VFVSDRTAKGNRELYVMDEQGINVTRLFADAAAWDMSPDWGPSLGDDSCTITGTINADVIVGTPGSDVICGLDGNDTMSGRGGNDLLVGGRGADTLVGGAGIDRLAGSGGNDVIDARDGRRDILNGGSGVDLARVDTRKQGKRRVVVDSVTAVERLVR